MIVFQLKMRSFGFESTIPFQTFYAKNGEHQNKKNDNQASHYDFEQVCRHRQQSSSTIMIFTITVR